MRVEWFKLRFLNVHSTDLAALGMITGKKKDRWAAVLGMSFGVTKLGFFLASAWRRRLKDFSRCCSGCGIILKRNQGAVDTLFLKPCRFVRATGDIASAVGMGAHPSQLATIDNQVFIANGTTAEPAL